MKTSKNTVINFSLSLYTEHNYLVWKANGSERAIAPWCYCAHHIVDFLGSRQMETATTSIEVYLCPTLGKSDEPSDLRGSLSPRTQHVLVYTAPGCPRRSPIQLWIGLGVA